MRRSCAPRPWRFRDPALAKRQLLEGVIKTIEAPDPATIDLVRQLLQLDAGVQQQASDAQTIAMSVLASEPADLAPLFAYLCGAGCSVAAQAMKAGDVRLAACLYATGNDK